jgi:hypothetical protein
VAAAELLRQLPEDADLTSRRVDIASPERGQLTPPETREGAEQHERAVPRSLPPPGSAALRPPGAGAPTPDSNRR